MVNFSFTGAFSLAWEVFKKRFLNFFTIIIIQIILTVILFLLLFNNLNNINSQTITESITLSLIISKLLTADVVLFLLFTIVIECILTAHTCTIVKSYALDDDLKGFKYTLKNIWYFIGGSVLLAIAMICIILVFVILVFIPLVKFIAIIAFIPFIIYFIGYFRFVPYYIFIQRSYDQAFYNTKRILKGQFWGSILILVVFEIINLILNSIVKDYQQDLVYAIFNSLKQQDILMIYLIIQVVMILVTYFHAMVDISFITLAIKNDRNQNSDQNEQVDVYESDSSYNMY